MLNNNETQFHIRASVAREGPKTRDKLKITARITLSIPAIFLNVKKICKKCENFSAKSGISDKNSIITSLLTLWGGSGGKVKLSPIVEVEVPAFEDLSRNFGLMFLN